MTPKNILWLENEPQYWDFFADYLRREGHQVRITTRVSEAESLLCEGPFNLLILDVMIPTWDAEEEKIYPPDQTQQGRLTGLEFYKRMKDHLKSKGIPVLVYTIRRETQLLAAFKDAGLPEGCFATKSEYRDPEALLRKLQEIARPA